MANIIKRFFNLQDNSKKEILQCSITSPSESQETKQFTRFSRKPDSNKPLDKKKKSEHDVSMLCYLTSNNNQETGKITREKLLNSKSQVNLQKISFLSPKNSMISECNTQIQPTQKFFKRRTQTSKNIRLNNSRSEAQLQIQSRIIFQKQSAHVPKINRQIKKDRIRESKQKVQEPNNFKELVELKKLKNQNQHFQTLITAKDKQIQNINKANSQLKNQLIEVRRKLKKSEVNEQKLQKQIKQISVKNKELMETRNTFQKSFEKKEANYKDQIMKKIDRIKYLTEVIDKLNYQINQMTNSSSKLIDNNNNLSINSKQGRRAGSCYNPSTSVLDTTNNVQDLSEDMSDNFSDNKNSIIEQLRNQLKYSEIQINMLKKVKLDVNKNCQEFYKLQRQNKLLKSKIFQMSTGKGFQKDKQSRQNRLMSKQDKNNKDCKRYVYHYQDKVSELESSDTFSLALSFSPQKQTQK